MRELDAGNRGRGVVEGFEAFHRRPASLDRAMILLNNVVQIFARPNLDVAPDWMLAPQLPQRTTARNVSVEGHFAWPARRVRCKRFAEERLRRSDATVPAQQKVDRLAALVDGSIQVVPPTADENVGFVDTPRSADRSSESIPAFLEPWHLADDPPHDRGVRYRDTAVGHQLDQVAVGQPKADLPAHAQRDDLGVEGAPAVDWITSRRLRHGALPLGKHSSYRNPQIHRNVPPAPASSPVRTVRGEGY